MKTALTLATAASSLVLALGTAPVYAEGMDHESSRNEQAQVKGPVEDVRESAQVLQQMQSSSDDLNQLIEDAEGVLVIPDYATAALLIGGSGGEGVLYSHKNGDWSDPVMYDIGSVSAGLQAGASAGSIALIIRDEQAMNSFLGDNNFSLNAEAGFSIVNWSDRVQGSIGKGDDVVVWSDMEGLFAEAALSISDISWDEEENEQYYGQQVTPDEILAGKVDNPHKEYVSQVLGN